MHKKNDTAKMKKVAMRDLTPKKTVKGGGSKPGGVADGDFGQ